MYNVKVDFALFIAFRCGRGELARFINEVLWKVALVVQFALSCERKRRTKLLHTLNEQRIIY